MRNFVDHGHGARSRGAKVRHHDPPHHRFTRHRRGHQRLANIEIRRGRQGGPHGRDIIIRVRIRRRTRDRGRVLQIPTSRGRDGRVDPDGEGITWGKGCSTTPQGLTLGQDAADQWILDADARIDRLSGEYVVDDDITRRGRAFIGDRDRPSHITPRHQLTITCSSLHRREVRARSDAVDRHGLVVFKGGICHRVRHMHSVDDLARDLAAEASSDHDLGLRTRRQLTQSAMQGRIVLRA